MTLGVNSLILDGWSIRRVCGIRGRYSFWVGKREGKSTYFERPRRRWDDIKRIL